MRGGGLRRIELDHRSFVGRGWRLDGTLAREKAGMATMIGANSEHAEPGVMAVGMRTTIWNLFSLAVALGLWQLGASLIGSPFFPGPLRIVEAFVQLATRGDTFGNSLLTHSWASVQRVLVGFGLGVLFGVPLGLLMGLYPKVYAGTRSVLEPFRFIPPIAWIPLAIIFFTGLTRFAFLIFLGAFFRCSPQPSLAWHASSRFTARWASCTARASFGRCVMWSFRPCCRISWQACALASAQPGSPS
jgi:hypothetical protein